MRRADAPKAGWYPDPTGGSRLWWWDGQDWTDRQRVPPPPPRPELLAAQEAAEAAGRGGGTGSGGRDGGGRGGYGVAPNLGRGTAADRARSSTGMSRSDASALVDEVRRATRTEIERATRDLGDRATDARKQLEPLISEYGGKLLRWVRRAAIVGGIVWVLYLLGSAIVQTSLIDWLGDRVDNAVNGTAVVVPSSIGPEPTSPASAIGPTGAAWPR